VTQPLTNGQGRTSGLVVVSVTNSEHRLRSRYEVVVITGGLVIGRKVPWERCLSCCKSSVLSGCLIHHCLCCCACLQSLLGLPQTPRTPPPVTGASEADRSEM
jgi:hypothetical protein